MFVCLLVFVTMLWGWWDSNYFSLLSLSVWSSCVQNIPGSRDKEYGCAHQESWVFKVFTWVLSREVTHRICHSWDMYYAILTVLFCFVLFCFVLFSLPAKMFLFWSSGLPCTGVSIDQALVQWLAKIEDRLSHRAELIPTVTVVSVVVDCPNQLDQIATLQKRQAGSLAI